MQNTTNTFFRTATSSEQTLISRHEESRYSREINAVRTLLIAEGVAALAVIFDLIFPFLHLGIIRRLILLVLDVFLLYVTLVSLNITMRQRCKIKGNSYHVQDVTITDVRNEFHGLRSDMIVTFTNDKKETYVLNTNTTRDAALVKGATGLLVIIDDEKNVLLTNNYRFISDNT